MSGSKTTQTNTALQPYLGAYSNLLSQGEEVASTPYTPYNGQYVQPFSPLQTQGFGVVSNTAGQTGYDTSIPYLDQAQTDFGAATTPLWSGVQQWSPEAVSSYMDPYTQQVVDATQKSFNLSNAEQAANLKGSTAAAGALGGDREAVMQAELAKQQNAAQAPVIANLYNTGYQTGQGEFNTEQAAQLGANEANSWLNSQAAFGEANLANEVPGLAYTGAEQLNTAGGEQQQLGQEYLNVPIEQYYAQQAYPFQTTQWLTGLETGLGGAAGSTSTTKTSQSALSSILGGLESAAGIAGMTGAFGSNGYLTGSSGSSGVPGMVGITPSIYGTMYGNSYAPTSVPGVNNPFGGSWSSGYRRGGNVGSRRGIVIPFPMNRVRRGIGGDIPRVDVDIVPPPMAATAGPPRANAQPPQPAPQSGGGSGGLNPAMLMQMASAFGAKRGGMIPHRDDGGDLDYRTRELDMMHGGEGYSGHADEPHGETAWERAGHQLDPNNPTSPSFKGATRTADLIPRTASSTPAPEPKFGALNMDETDDYSDPFQSAGDVTGIKSPQGFTLNTDAGPTVTVKGAKPRVQGRGIVPARTAGRPPAAPAPAAPANSNTPPVPAQATGTDSGMPFKDIDYKPGTMPDTWSKDLDNAPWMALAAAGAETLASGNVGEGIGAGLRSYMGIRNKANEAQMKAQEYADTGKYRQAEVEEGVNRLWQEHDDATKRIEQENARLGEETRHNKADEAEGNARIGIEASRLAHEESEIGELQPVVVNGVTKGMDKYGHLHDWVPVTRSDTDNVSPTSVYERANQDYDNRFSRVDPVTNQRIFWAKAPPRDAYVKDFMSKNDPNRASAPGGLPAGVTPDTALAQARDALRRNPKARGAILSRLQGWGISTSGL